MLHCFFLVIWHFYWVAFRLDFISQNFIYPSFALFCLFGVSVGYIGSVSFLNTILEVVSKLRAVNPKLTYGELYTKAQLSCDYEVIILWFLVYWVYSLRACRFYHYIILLWSHCRSIILFAHFFGVMEIIILLKATLKVYQRLLFLQNANGYTMIQLWTCKYLYSPIPALLEPNKILILLLYSDFGEGDFLSSFWKTSNGIIDSHLFTESLHTLLQFKIGI